MAPIASSGVTHARAPPIQFGPSNSACAVASSSPSRVAASSRMSKWPFGRCGGGVHSSAIAGIPATACRRSVIASDTSRFSRSVSLASPATPVSGATGDIRRSSATTDGFASVPQTASLRRTVWRLLCCSRVCGWRAKGPSAVLSSPWSVFSSSVFIGSAHSPAPSCGR